MRNAKALLLAVVLGLGLPTLHGHGDDTKGVRELMERKLHAAQKVLEGIALNDFDKIAKNADDMMQISKQAEWKILKSPQYELHSNDFRRIADNLARDAKKKNLDAAALSYVELTLTCVRCHKYVREVRMGRLDDPSPLPLTRKFTEE